MQSHGAIDLAFALRLLAWARHSAIFHTMENFFPHCGKLASAGSKTPTPSRGTLALAGSKTPIPLRGTLALAGSKTPTPLRGG